MLPLSPPAPAPAFTVQQLRQLRAQCLVFLAFRNKMEPKEWHLKIALGECPEGGIGSDRRGANGDESHGETASSSFSQASSSAGLPPPDPLPLSSLRLSSVSLSESSRCRSQTTASSRPG